MDNTYIKNYSLVMPVSRFKREFTGLLKQLSSKSHPLQKIIITRSGKRIAVVLSPECYDELASVKGLVRPAATP